MDLGDAVADELSLPFDQVSLEMIYRGLDHFYVTRQKGKASDLVKYFASPPIGIKFSSIRRVRRDAPYKISDRTEQG